MGDIDLLRKFQEIDKKLSTTKLELLKELKSKIETEKFICEISGEISGSEEWKKRLETDLQYIECSIIEYSKRVLKGDSMLKINEINKRYKR